MTQLICYFNISDGTSVGVSAGIFLFNKSVPYFKLIIYCPFVRYYAVCMLLLSIMLCFP